MDKILSIIPKPLSIENGNKEIELKNKSVCLKIEHAETTVQSNIENRMQTAFNIAGIQVGNDGIPVSIFIEKQNCV